MYKVLLVDDDFLIRTSIKSLIDWKAQGFFLCGEAENGRNALEMVSMHMPDIILTDVRMPEMDGLEMSTEIRRRGSNAIIIILSNYDDYEYVRASLKIGASDYLLKHNLNSGILLQTLQNAARLVDKATQSNDLKIEALNNMAVLKENFIKQLLSGFYINEDEIRMHIKSMDINLGLNDAVAIIMAVDGYNSLTHDKSLKDISLLESSIKNVTVEILQDNNNGEVIYMGNGKYVIILSFDSIKSTAYCNNSINLLLSRISSCVKKFLSISLSFSVGRMCTNIKDILTSYEDAEKILNNKFYAGINCILKHDTYYDVKDKEAINGLSIEEEKSILYNIRQMDIKALTESLGRIFEGIRLKKASPSSIRMIFNDLLGIVNKICKENNISFNTIYEDVKSPVDALLLFETMDETRVWILSVFEKLFSVLQQQRQSPYSDYVNMAIEYIKNNYSRNISLSSAADFIKISSAYLSKLFKDEVGIGFNEYLSNHRINEAKFLLKNGSFSFKDIAIKCGFNNQTYFYNTFKKKTGITPSKFISVQDDDN